MVHGTVRHFFQILGALGLVLSGAVPFFAWRVSSSPLSLEFLTPYVEEALTPPGGAYSVKLDETVLYWAGWRRTLDVRALGVKVVSAAGSPVASIPVLSFGLSLRALSVGLIAPRTVELVGARLHLLRRADGRFELDIGGAAPIGGPDEGIGPLMEAALAPPDMTRPTGYLTRFRLADSTVVIDDEILGATWTVADVGLELVRDRQGIGVAGGLAVATPDGPARFDVDGRYAAADRKISLRGKFASIRPASFARIAPGLDPLAGFDLPVSGAVSVRLDPEGGVLHSSLDLSAAPGTMRLPDPVANTYHVRSLKLRAEAEGMERLSLDHLEIDIGGPLVIASGFLGRTVPGGEFVAGGKARVLNMPVSDLPAYWPPAIAPKPRAWIVASLHDGVVPEADFSVAVRGTDPGHVALEAFSGDLTVRGVSVDYLTPMPLVRKGDARVRFAPDRIDISVLDGGVNGLKITRGTVVITGMDQVDQDADIDLTITGSVRDSLALVDSKPLGYASKYGIRPDRSEGEATTRLTLKFPLFADLPIERVDVLAVARLERLSLGGAAMGKDLGKGTIDLRVDRKSLAARGTAVLGDVPIDLEWEENFSRAAPFVTRYRVKGTLDDGQRASFGLGFPPLAPPLMTGPLSTRAVITMDGKGRSTIEAQADLGGVRVVLPGLGWIKPAEGGGRAEVLARFEKGRLSAVPMFSATADSGLDVRGDVAVGEDGAPRRVTFERFKAGRTDVAGTLDLAAGGGLAIRLRGAGIDLAPALGASPDESPPRPPDPAAPPLDIDLSANRLWASENGHFDKIEAHLSRKSGLWNYVNLEATVGDGKAVSVWVVPGSPERRIEVAAEDAGDVLRALGIFETMIGGKLEIKGTIDASDTTKGICSITDYRVIKAPLLARLLTVAALTGILESLTGDGLRFTHLELPFTRADGVLTISDAQAYGPSLGLTAKGKVHSAREQIDIEGTVVPAYVLNSLLGKIPLVGDLLTGEKGGGVFAANYSLKGPMADPAVSVNPLSVLTPGFLRKLFHVFDDKEDTDGKEKEKETSQPE